MMAVGCEGVPRYRRTGPQPMRRIDGERPSTHFSFRPNPSWFGPHRGTGTWPQPRCRACRPTKLRSGSRRRPSTSSDARAGPGSLPTVLEETKCPAASGESAVPRRREMPRTSENGGAHADAMGPSSTGTTEPAGPDEMGGVTFGRDLKPVGETATVSARARPPTIRLRATTTSRT